MIIAAFQRVAPHYTILQHVKKKRKISERRAKSCNVWHPNLSVFMYDTAENMYDNHVPQTCMTNVYESYNKINKHVWKTCTKVVW